MAEPECPQRGPYVIDEVPGKKWWCACGRSQKQPYCDGSHKGTEISPLPIEIDSPQKIAWCGCKRTGKAPLCDGSHARLP